MGANCADLDIWTALKAVACHCHQLFAIKHTFISAKPNRPLHKWPRRAKLGQRQHCRDV